MKGNCHVRFLGEEAAAMLFPYPTFCRRYLPAVKSLSSVKAGEFPSIPMIFCHSSRSILRLSQNGTT